MRNLYEFQKHLKRTEHSLAQAQHLPERLIIYQNEAIHFDNGYALSIQCHSCAYCSPRESFLDPTAYYEYEVGILYKDGNVDFSDFFRDNDYTGVEDTWLLAYCPCDKIQLLYDHIKEIRTKYTPRPKKIDDLFNDFK